MLGVHDSSVKVVLQLQQQTCTAVLGWPAVYHVHSNC